MREMGATAQCALQKADPRRSAQGQNPKCSSTITRPLSPAADMPLHWLWSEKCRERAPSTTSEADMILKW